jgi:hypothetical protein
VRKTEHCMMVDRHREQRGNAINGHDDDAFDSAGIQATKRQLRCCVIQTIASSETGAGSPGPRSRQQETRTK